MVKLENSSNKKKIGILGGTFDPAHKGHLAISKEAIKKFNLKYVIWAITKRSPFKNKSQSTLKKRIFSCKKIINKNKLIKIKYYDDLIKSNKTVDLINHLSTNKKVELYFLMGADNLINFHKWYKWKLISQKCKILVFDRHGYKKKSLNSKAFKHLDKKQITFVEFEIVNISSSQLRKI
tara:strand:- start:1083 stop:1619 length:537 start_codon:yes stop_codon:yes gene_type:complete